MAIPASGPVSMSMLNVELGRSFDTANSALAGSSTPSIGSLFYLGAQSGSLNQTAPHAISEWYGYTTITPQATLKYDAYSSSYDGSVSVNLGSGGTTYNLNETGTVETGSGTNLGSNYYNINLPGTTTGYLTSSFSPVPSNTSFSISIMAFITGSSGQLFSIELATGNRLYIETNFVTTGVYDVRANLYSAGTRVVYLSGSINQNDWNHIVWVHDNSLTTNDSKLYINNALAQSVTATNNISQTDAYQIRVGINIISTIVSYRLGSVSFWNGYYLAPLQIEDLYNEFYDRYVYVPV